MLLQTRPGGSHFHGDGELCNRADRWREGCPPSFCVSEPQNACFPILVPHGALLAALLTPERGKKSSGLAESIYGRIK